MYTDVAPWCYKWIGYGIGGWDWIGLDRIPGGVKYRAPHDANNDKCTDATSETWTPHSPQAPLKVLGTFLLVFNKKQLWP